MKKIIILFLISSINVLNAQKVEERNLGSFSEITLSSVANVVLIQSDNNKVVVDAPSHQLNNVITKLYNDNLDISIKGNWQNEQATIYVYAPTIHKIITSGAAIIKSEGVFKTENLKISASGASLLTLSINTTNLKIDASGAAVITLLGYTYNTNIEASGAVIIKGKEMSTANASLKLSGASKSSVNVEQTIKGTVTGAAVLEISGNPSVNEINNSSVSTNANIDKNIYFEDVEITNDIVGDIKYKETMDSTYVSVGNKKVIIVEDIDKTRIDVQLKDSTKEKSVTLSPSIDVGMNGYLTSSNEISLPVAQNLMQINYSRSREFSWHMMISGLDFAKERLYFTTGLGFNYSGYHFKNNINISTSNDSTEFKEILEPNYNKYKLRATYLQVPMLLGVRIGNVKKDYGIQLGVISGMKIGSLVKEKYNLDGKNVKNKVKDDYNLSPFKVSATLRLRFNWFSIYANYALTPLFEKNKAPELYPFSIGLTFGLN